MEQALARTSDVTMMNAFGMCASIKKLLQTQLKIADAAKGLTGKIAREASQWAVDAKMVTALQIHMCKHETGNATLRQACIWNESK